MSVFDKSKIILRKYIKENPEKVRKDLEEMRKKSEGKDLQWYISKLSGK